MGDLHALVRRARWRASFGLYTGKMDDANMCLIRACAHALPLSPEHQANIIYTRDVGHHSGGWWKNPDYERCLHLSLSYRDQRGSLPHDRRQSAIIARAFFVDDVRLAWIEAPYSAEGKASDVWHYRVFCDPSWAPILPRGEVYHRANTPAGWRSFSDVHGLAAGEVDAPFLLEARDDG